MEHFYTIQGEGYYAGRAAYFIRLGDNLWSFASIVRNYYDSFANAQEMALIFEMPYEIVDETKKEAKDIKGEVKFENTGKVLKPEAGSLLIYPSDYKVASEPGAKNSRYLATGYWV